MRVETISSPGPTDLIAFVTLALWVSSATLAATSVRGVAPDDLHLYQPSSSSSGKASTWKCLKSDQIIPASAINDDYCDCHDGSDEPGTSACANSTFYCQNEGHIPAQILSSRVNDGVCEPECCDGTDEYEDPTRCPNVCASVGKEYRKRKTQEENVRRAGSKTRARYIAERKKSLEQLEADVAKLEVEVEVAREREQRTKAALEAAEKMDEHVIEQKKQSPLYQTLKAHQEALRGLMDKKTEMTRELERLTSLLDDLAKGYNPNYQDMAVKGAVMAYRSWRRGEEGLDDLEAGESSDSGGADDASKAAANQKPIDEEEPTTLNALRSEGKWPASTLRDMIDVDPLSLMDDEAFKSTQDESGILFRIHEYLPDAIVPYFEAAVDTVLDLLLKANIIAEVKRSKSSRKLGGGEGGAETESVTAARSIHRKAQDSLRQLEQDLNRKRDDAQLAPEKWGQEGEFKALDGVCVDRNMGEYTYEFCFFKSATQKPNRGHGNVSLGRFSRFAPKDETTKPNNPAFYLRQIYDAGQRCWNGPDRSLIVDFVCAPDNALLDVFEGEKCIYEAKVSTPAVCLPLDNDRPAAAAAADFASSTPTGKDEL